MEFDSHSWVLWVGVIAAGLHVLEEYAEGWVHWANQELGPRFGVSFTDGDFFLTNALLVFFALAGAAIGWWAPAISLSVPALFVINAVFFHMLPSARGERLTPGTLSAVFVYLPVAAWMFWAAADDGVLDFGTFLLSFVLGAAIMAYPIAVLVLKNRIGWQEGDARPDTKTAAAAAATATGPSAPAESTPPEQVLEQLAEEGPTGYEATDAEEASGSAGEDRDDGEDDTVLLVEDAAVEADETVWPGDESGDDKTTEMKRD